MPCQRMLIMHCAKYDDYFHGPPAPLIHVNVRLLSDLCALVVESSKRFGLNLRLIMLDFSWQRARSPSVQTRVDGSHKRHVIRFGF